MPESTAGITSESAGVAAASSRGMARVAIVGSMMTRKSVSSARPVSGKGKKSLPAK